MPPPSFAAGQLSPHQYAEAWDALEHEQFDLVIVGGGVTGAGAALDAASRGLTVLLVEARDLAAGTSSKSSKLIHGGLRYLEMLDFGLVRESLAERRRLLTEIAPHLVKPVRFIWPLTHHVWERAYLGAGLLLYDTMGGAGAVPFHRHLSKSTIRTTAPGLDPDTYTGGVQFYDAFEDDARMVVCIARTAQAHGARVLTGVRAGEPIRVDDRVVGVQVHRNDGATRTVRTRHVAYATGVWSDRVVSDALTVRPSKGVHIMVPRSAIDIPSGILMRTEKSVLFVIPWGNHWLIGDTDTDWPLDPDTVVASRTDLDYLLGKVNSVLTRDLTHDDVVGVFAGLRPLVQSDPTADTTKLSREHSVVSGGRDVTVIAGGKYTTYRVMARDLIDAVIAESQLQAGPSLTDRIPLLGAAGYAERRDRTTRIADENGLSAEVVEHLLGRHGDRIDDLLELIAHRPDLGKTVDGYEPYLWAELFYAVTHEGARSLEDVLERRTRIKIQYRDSGTSIAAALAELIAPELNWDAAERERRIADYLSRIEGEFRARTSTDDQAAVEAYIGALQT